MIGSAVSWVVVSGGDWNTGSNWSSGSVPSAGTDTLVTLAASVSMTSPGTAHSLTIDNAGASVAVLFSSLNLGGVLAIEAGSFILDGTLSGGTVVASGGTFVIGPFGPVLAGVTYQGTLTVNSSLENLTLDGITLLGTSGTGSGVLAVTAGTATFGTTQTLVAGTIELGGQGVLDAAQGATLTLGPGVLTQSTGSSETIEGAVVNAGTIVAATGGDVLAISGSLLNQGRILISGNDEVLIAAGTTLSNSGTITVSAGGTLNLQGMFANAGSINAAGGTILVGGAVTQAEMLALDASGGAVVVAGTFANAGGTLLVGAGTALGTLTVAGAIKGGTIQDKGGGIVLAGGTLDGVTYRGTLAVTSSPSQSNAIIDGLTLSGPAGTGSGTLLVTGAVTFANTESLAAGIIDLGGPIGPASLSVGANATLTLGVGVDLEQTGAVAALGATFSFGALASSSSGQVLISQGTIDAGFAQGSMTLGSGAELLNQGLMEVRNGETFLAQGALVNAGTLSIGTGGTLEVFGSSLWSNGGKLLGAGGTVLLGGPITDAELLSFAGSGAAIVVAGTIGNGSSTIAIGAASALGPLTLGVGGVIHGGTIQDSGGGLIGASGTLDGVSYRGTLGLTHAHDLLTVADGVTLTGAGSGISLVGNGAALIFSGSQTLNATVAIGGSGAEADLETGLSGSTLVLAASSVVTQTGRLAGFIEAGATIANQGTILAMFAGGSFNLGVAGGVLVNTGTISVGNGDVATIGSLVNAGQITVGTGGVLTLAQYSASPGGRVVETNATLNLDGSLTLAALAAVTRSGGVIDIGGTLDLGGGTLALGTGTALVQLRDTGVIADGTITDAGGGMVFYGGVGELLNVTYRGLVNLTPALSNLIVQGLTVTGTAGTGPGAVNVLGAGSTLTFQGSQIFDNGTINFGSNAETDTLMISDPTGAGVVLTLGGNANLQQRGVMARIVIGRGLGDALVNNGLIAANQAGGDMIVLGGTFTNAGRVVVAVGDTLTLQADQVSNLVGGLLNGGYWEIGSGSTLDLGMDNPILNLNAAMVLNGPGSQVQYYNTTTFQTTNLEQTLNYIGSAGVLVLENGRAFNDPGLFYVIGKVVMANGILSAAPVAIGATALVYGSGVITANAIYDSGHLLAQNGALVLNTPLLGGSPVGNALIAAGATLVANQAVTVPVEFQASTGTLALGQATSMYGTVFGFTGSDAIDLVNVGTAGVSLSYAPGAGAGVLTVKTGAATDATLHFNGNYVLANFRFTSDGHAGTLILDPPVPPLSLGSADWAVTLGDLAAPPATTASGIVGGGGTIASGSAIAVPPQSTQPSLLAHQ